MNFQENRPVFKKNTQKYVRNYIILCHKIYKNVKFRQY